MQVVFPRPHTHQQTNNKHLPFFFSETWLNPQSVHNGAEAKTMGRFTRWQAGNIFRPGAGWSPVVFGYRFSPTSG